VPPPPVELGRVLADFEVFLHDEDLTPLVHAGLAHAQFETIHPFLDGNGRIGRLLITFLLCRRGVLKRPLLYLSHFFKRHRAEYTDRLQAIRTDGAWEQWMAFFLRGVLEVASEATLTANRILALRELVRERLSEAGRGSGTALRAVDRLFQTPLITPTQLAGALDVSYVTANGVLARLERDGVVRESTGGRRNRVFAFYPYLDLFSAAHERGGPERVPEESPEPVTVS